MNPASEAAACVAHPTEKAIGTCTRCGNFMCATCKAGSAEGYCPRCLALRGAPFPFSRDAWSFSQLFDFAWQRFKIDGVMLSVGAFLVGAVGSAIGGIGQGFMTAGGDSMQRNPALLAVVLGVSQIASIIAQGVMQIGFTQMVIDSIQGKKPELGRLFDGFKQLGRYLLLVLLMGAIVLPIILVLGGGAGVAAYLGRDNPVAVVAAVSIALLALVPAAFFLFLPLGFAVPELVYNPEAGPMEILKNCFAIARDNRWNMFGVGFMAGLIVFVGVLACCIGAVPASALAQLLNISLFLTLRNGSEVQATSPMA